MAAEEKAMIVADDLPYKVKLIRHKDYYGWEITCSGCVMEVVIDDVAQTNVIMCKRFIARGDTS